MRVLLIEDNITTADYLMKGLKEHYFLPDLARDGKEGLYLATENKYDILLLDVMVPFLNGWDILNELRTKHISTPALFLTARDSIEDKLKGFQVGADDYLIKPFSFSELIARMNALLKRHAHHNESIIKVSNLTIDTLKHKVTRGEETIRLSAKEYMLLLFLAKRTGETLSRTLIAEHVWDIHFDTDTNVIDVAIKRLRDKIDHENHPIKLLHTIRGIGYVLEAR